MNPIRFVNVKTITMALVLPLAVTGCASLGGGSYIPSADQVPALEARIRTSPNDAESLTRLGAAYQRDGRLDEAASLLERAKTANPNNATTAFTLGAVYQGQERLDAALVEYQRYLALSPTGASRGRVEGYITLIRREQLRGAVRVSIANEATLARQPAGATVAVFPFQFNGSDERLQPLGRAMAEMLATDLSQTERLQVLERVQIQALLDEVAMGQSGAMDLTSAARGGRLLGAGRVVQGQVSGNEQSLRLDAAVVEVGATGRPNVLTEEDAGARLFQMEKQLAFQLYDEMGVPLTAAERERVNRRSTENLEAMLAFGRGLQASDQGNYAEARQFFNQASRLDPKFSAARALESETESLEQAETSTTAEVVEAVVEVSAEIVNVEAVSAAAEAAGTRDAAAESQGTEGVAKKAVTPVTIILRRPGGGL